MFKSFLYIAFKDNISPAFCSGLFCAFYRMWITDKEEKPKKRLSELILNGQTQVHNK